MAFLCELHAAICKIIELTLPAPSLDCASLIPPPDTLQTCPTTTLAFSLISVDSVMRGMNIVEDRMSRKENRTSLLYHTASAGEQ